MAETVSSPSFTVSWKKPRSKMKRWNWLLWSSTRGMDKSSPFGKRGPSALKWVLHQLAKISSSSLSLTRILLPQSRQFTTILIWVRFSIQPTKLSSHCHHPHGHSDIIWLFLNQWSLSKSILSWLGIKPSSLSKEFFFRTQIYTMEKVSR